MTGLSRRALIGRGLAGAGALALPGSLVAAATAQAQEDAQTDAVKRVVVLEQALELAYSVASEDATLDDAAKKLFDELTVHAGDHATAFAEAMNQLAVDPPGSSSDPAAYPSLDDFDTNAPQMDILAFFVDRETELIQAYEEDELNLDEPDLIRSSAQVAASHAQALVALRLLAKAKGNLAEMPKPAASATGG